MIAENISYKFNKFKENTAHHPLPLLLEKSTDFVLLTFHGSQEIAEHMIMIMLHIDQFKEFQKFHKSQELLWPKVYILTLDEVNHAWPPCFRVLLICV